MMHHAQPVDAAQLRALLAGARPTLVCFAAEWSAPCREMAPELDRLADSFYGTLEVVTVDPDAEPLLANDLHIASLPTLLLYVGGTERSRIVGRRGYDELEKKLLRELEE